VSANRQFPILDWVFDYQKDWLQWDLIAGLIATATRPSGSRHFELRCQRNGANGLAVASRLAPSSEQANFSSADIVSLIGKCLTPETGEVFLTEHKKLLVCVSSMQRNVQDFPPVVC
jgi:hypothetical protein